MHDLVDLADVPVPPLDKDELDHLIAESVLAGDLPVGLVAPVLLDSPPIRSALEALSQGSITVATPCDRGEQHDEESYGNGLLRRYAEGRLEPVPVTLPNVPEDAPESVRVVVADLELIFGLRLALGDKRPTPYACRWRQEVLDLGYKTISRILRQLVEWGALEDHGRMKRLPDQPRGTRLFGVPGLDMKDREPVKATPGLLANRAITRAREHGGPDGTGARDSTAFWLGRQLSDNRIPLTEAEEAMAVYWTAVAQAPGHRYEEWRAKRALVRAYALPRREPWGRQRRRRDLVEF